MLYSTILLSTFDFMDEKKIQWCIDRHKQSNHFYDTYLPYEFHLRMVVHVCDDFIHLPENRWSELEIACWGHDLIEDTRTSYNECVEELGRWVSEIIYAVTNEKGRNRKERANNHYYDGIRNTDGAVFVKLCDRIANVQYSKMTKSRMFEMYKKENCEFTEKLGYTEDHRFEQMFSYLKDLFN